MRTQPKCSYSNADSKNATLVPIVKHVARTCTHKPGNWKKEACIGLFAHICCESASGSIFHTCKGRVTHTGNAEFAAYISKHITQIVFIFKERNPPTKEKSHWRLYFSTYDEKSMTCLTILNGCIWSLILISIKTWSTDLLFCIDFCLSGNLLVRVDCCWENSILVQAVKWGQIGGAQFSTGVPGSAGI